MKKNLFNQCIIYIHIFFLAVGTSTLSPKIGLIPILDFLLIIYFIFNFKSITNTFREIKDIAFVLGIFVFIQLVSTVVNSYLIINTTPDNIISLLQYISYLMILIVYYDFLRNNPFQFDKLIILFLLGVLSLICVDIYAASQIVNWNFYDNYGRYIFAEKYSNDKYCITSSFCYSLINVNTLGSYVGIVSFLFFGLLMNPTKSENYRFNTLLFLLLIIFMFISIGLGQKTAYVSYILLLITTFIYLSYLYIIKIFLLGRVLIITFLILLMLIIFYDSVIYFLETLYFRTIGDNRLSSFSTRFDFVLHAINLITSPVSILIGNGKDNYFFETGINDPHNINAQFLLETGIIGFILYSYLIFKIILNAYRHGAFFACSFIIMYMTISNANGLAFQSHTAWISFVFIFYLGTKKNLN